MDKLNNKQFVTVALIIILIGVAILGRDYFELKRMRVYEHMSVVLSENTDPQPIEEDDDDPYPTPVVTPPPVSGDNSSTPSEPEEPQRRQERRPTIVYNYVGRLIIPKIKLNQGFLKINDKGNNIEKNVAVVPGSEYPTIEAGNLILAAHNGPASKSNTFFRNIDKLGKGDLAVVQYDGKKYSYKLVERYTSPKDHYRIKKVKIHRNGIVKQLTLITCYKEKKSNGRYTYDLNYLVEIFHLVGEIDCNGRC